MNQSNLTYLEKANIIHGCGPKDVKVKNAGDARGAHVVVSIGGVSLDDVRPRDIYKMLKGSSWGGPKLKPLGYYAKNKIRLIQIVEALYVQASFFDSDLSDGREVGVVVQSHSVCLLYWSHVLFSILVGAIGVVL